MDSTKVDAKLDTKLNTKFGITVDAKWMKNGM